MSKKLSHFLFYIYIITSVFYYITSITELRYIVAVSGLVVFIFYSKTIATKYWVIYIIVYLISTGLFINALINANFIGFNAFILIIAQLGIVLFMLKDKINPQIMLVIFYLFCSYFVFLMLTGVSYREILFEKSYNHISVIIIFLNVLLYISYYQNNLEIPLLPATITFIISVWVIGRSGIICSSALLIFILLNNYRKHAKKIWLFLLLVPMILVLGNNIIINFGDSSFLFYKFYRGQLFNDIRFDIIKYYIQDIGAKELLFGSGSVYVYYGDIMNAHNSYIYSHNYIGFISLVIYFLALVALIKAFFYNKLLFALLFVIMLRAFTDTILFPGGVFDFVLYYLVTFIICETKTNFKSNLSLLKKPHFPNNQKDQ